MRRSARIEHKATPITRTTTEIGFRNALRRSHMSIALLVGRYAALGETAQDRLVPPRPKRGSARPQGAPARHRFPPARENSVRPIHQRASRAPPDSVRVPAFPSCVRPRVRPACCPRLCARRPVRLAPCEVVPSGLAASGRSGPPQLARSLLPLSFLI